MAEKKPGHESTWGASEVEKQEWADQNGDAARAAVEKQNKRVAKKAAAEDA